MSTFADFRMKTVLAPLDGSPMAESIFPALESLAGAFDARIVLLHVQERGAPGTVHGQQHLNDPSRAVEYLTREAARMSERGVDCEFHVHDTSESDLAGSILEHAGEYSPDMVALCTHGSAGIRDLFTGNIAQQVLRRGIWPTLVVQPEAEPTGKFGPKCILLPYDGRHSNSQSMQLAATLARAYGSRLHLVLVEATRETLRGEGMRLGQMLPSTMRAMLSITREADAQQLADAVAGLRAAGVEATSEVMRGECVAEVAQAAERADAGLVVISSHGRAGMDALISGSVAARLTARMTCPVLLCRDTE